MKEKKIPIILFSLLFAFLVWISVNLGNTFQTTLEFPVTIENLRPNQAIATPLPSSIALRIQGTGWQLVNAMLSPGIHYTIDFSSISRRDTLFTFKHLAERINLPKEIIVFETSPETVFVRLDQKISTTIAVEPKITALFREGFGMVGKIRTEPDSVVVTGARALLSDISRWNTRPMTISDINTPVSMVIPLVDSLSNEITLSHTYAKVYFDVQPIAERTIDNIPVEVNQVPGNRSVVLIPPTVSVIIRSGVNAITPLQEKDFYAFIDYKSILLDTSGYVLPIIHGPENVQIVQQIPDRIQYVVRK
ncbi:MAG: CdaR family protein [Bacteroidota bacterium]